ncbi:hypothetical protein N9Y41_04475 [Planktomarina temperata]|nr:hypothetical protein [Planktomarina temperata]
MSRKKLENQFGLNNILQQQGDTTKFCQQCRDHEIHQLFSIPWKRYYFDEVDFRQKYQILKCKSCHLVKFIEKIWCEELDEYDSQGSAEGEIVENNMDRDPDIVRCYPPNFSDAEQLLLAELRKTYDKQEIYFVEEVFTAIHAGLYKLASIGIRSIIENFYYKVGTQSARSNYVEENARKQDGTSKTKNEYKYKLLWLESQNIITSAHKTTLHDIIRVGNHAAHTMKTSASKGDKLIMRDAVLAILSLAIQFNKLKLN